jgi:hypothetical protein
MLRRLFVLLVAVVCAACTSPGDVPVPASTAPLPTAAAGPLLCKMVPEASVRAVLGDREYEVDDPGLHYRPDGELDFGDCSMHEPGKRWEEYLHVSVDAYVDRSVLREVYTRGREYIFPAAVGPGIAQHQDGGGVAKVQWGDYALTVNVYRGAAGRDAMRDAIALTQQVAHAMKLSKTPSKPYPSRAELLGPTPSASP